MKNPQTADPEPYETADPPPPEPAPAADQDREAADQDLPTTVIADDPGGIDFTRVIASVVTAASAVFTVWSVWDLSRLAGEVGEEGQTVPHVVGLGAGVGVEAVWLWLLAIEWKQASTTGRVSPALTRTGWALALLASVVLVVHGVVTSWPMVLLAVLPLAAKAGWHWLTTLRCERTRARLEAAAAAAREARRREEEDQRRAQKLSTGLSPEQEEELAQIRSETVYVRAKADVESELTTAKAEADRKRQKADAESERIRRQTESQMRQEAVNLQVQEQMTIQRANVSLLKQRNELQVELQLTSPFELGAGAGGPYTRVPDDPSGFGLPPVGGAPVAGTGFGFAHQAHAGGATGATGATPVDLRVPQGAAPAATAGATGAAPSAAPAATADAEADSPQPKGRTWPRPPTPEQGQRQLVEYAQWQLGRGETLGIRDAARRMDCSPRSVSRYREALMEDAEYAQLMEAFNPQS
ncbi:hypothetical protein [Nocardiopsis sp. NPDC055824]